MKWVVYVTTVGEMRDANEILVRKHKGKRPSVKPSHRRGYYIKMDLHKT